MEEYPPAVNYLMEQGVRVTSDQRISIIGCIGCRWATAEEQERQPEVYAAQIQQCTGLAFGTIVTILGKLEAAGVVSSTVEDIDPVKEGRRQRRLYGPADTEVGQGLLERSSKPEKCGFEARANMPSKAQALIRQVANARMLQMTQVAMAKELGVSQPRVSHIENSKSVELSTFIAYAGILGLEVVVQPIEEPAEDTEA
jgi:predicted XRE-type DNA-binding protein